MDFKTYYQGLSQDERKKFATHANTSTAYIEVHLLPRRKIPKPPLLDGLASACLAMGADITKGDLLAFFYRTEAPSVVA
ncbi:hypothetical protein [Pandoraea commovens]|uniref:Transcriptional regulator n=1 Tax=Pandoraea commovens TaxID=2508289 RepID=A0A5E4VE62_9BURK|nr:hypothetical protein [Pandoraea commovens]VVE10073.1 hypothetical protein PCO31010_02602 [Pandoraea commovens]